MADRVTARWQILRRPRRAARRNAQVSRYNDGMLKQLTLKQMARTVGIGLHSGTKVELVLRPAAADTGIVFRRVDLDPPVDIALSPEAVVDTRMATTIGRDDVRIATIEHLMSALAGLGIDNCYIDVDAPRSRSWTAARRASCS